MNHIRFVQLVPRHPFGRLTRLTRLVPRNPRNPYGPRGPRILSNLCQKSLLCVEITTILSQNRQRVLYVQNRQRNSTPLTILWKLRVCVVPLRYTVTHHGGLSTVWLAPYRNDLAQLFQPTQWCQNLALYNMHTPPTNTPILWIVFGLSTTTTQ